MPDSTNYPSGGRNHDASAARQSLGVRTNSFSRWQCRMVGVSPDQMDTLAGEELSLATTLFWLLVATAALNFTCLLCGLASQGNGLAWYTGSAVIAALVALVIASVDRRGIVISWVEAGTAMLVREGLIKEGWQERFGRILVVATRLGLSLAVSAVVGTLAAIALMKFDIDADKANFSRAQNVIPYAAATAAFAQEESGYAASLAAANARVNAAAQERAALLDGPGDGPPEGLLARDIRQLEEERKRRADLEREASSEDGIAAAEVAGIADKRANPNGTGRRGNGAVAVWHRNEASRLRRDAADSGRRVDALESEIRVLRADQAAHRKTTSQQDMGGLATREDAAVAVRDKAAADLVAFRDSRGAWIDRAARQHPAWVSVSQGLLGDLGALKRILDASLPMAFFVVTLKAVIIMLEASCCLTKVLSPNRGIYAVRRVAEIEEELAEAAATVRRSRLDADYMAAMGQSVRERAGRQR